MTNKSDGRIAIDEPRWDQSTFIGRLKYFAWVTDPRTLFTRKADLLEARDLVQLYRQGREPEWSTLSDVLRARQLELSAFHPDSGDLQNIFGRMSCQVPGGMAITGALLTFYKTTPAVVFWQWVNQSFNALVNYTNRNAKSAVTEKQIGVAYVSATASAVAVSIGLKGILAKRASLFFQRFVPFAAVAAANMVNIPLMRQSELTEGIACFDENGNEVVKSKYAAVKGISQVVISRIVIAMPGMTLTPFVMQMLEKRPWMKRYGRYVDAPLQTLIVGCFLLAMVPIGCALFPQKCSIPVERLSVIDKPELDTLKEHYKDGKLPSRLYFNKGL